MPTYEYECRECSHSFEVFQAMSDEPLKSCPKCEKEVRRLIFGGTGVIFKGSGFYVTDKNKGSRPPKPGSKTESASSGEAASGGKPGSCGAQCPAASSSAGCPMAGGEGAKGKPAPASAG